MKRRHVLQGAGALALAEAGHRALAAQPPRKVLRIAFPAAETSFDPPQTNSDLYSSTIIAQILEAPLGYDYLARPAALVPVTAAALPEIAADGRSFTMRIRAGIFFADDPAFGGRPRELVAQDYVYALKRFYDPQYNSSDLYLFETPKLPGLSELREKAIKQRSPFDYDTEVEGVRVLDRYTLRIKLGAPDPRFVYVLAQPSIMGAVAREVVEKYGKEIGAHPVGTGAFRLKSWRRASRIVLERSPSFRHVVYEGTPADEPLAQEISKRIAGQRLPLVDEVQVDIVEESQPRWLSFLDGSYHWLELPGDYAGIAVPKGKLAPFLQKKGIRAQAALQADMAMSFFFMEHPLVGGYTPPKVALRRAVSLAFDGDTYIRHVMGGMAIPAQSTIGPFTSGYDAAYKSEMSEHSPARARALLDLYGYVDRDGDGWREQPDGQPLVLRMATMSSQRDRLSNEIWKRSMDKVGLRMEFEVSTWPELLKKSRAGTLMMWGYGWTATSPDGGFFLGIAYGPHASEANDPRFALPAFDRLFEQQQRLPDGPQRNAVMREAKNLLVAYMPYKVHYHRIRTDLVQPWTHHFWRHPFMRDTYRFIDVDPQP
jgi:ABC-type transport system substrate-binding protein